jgi:hypothetical protein
MDEAQVEETICVVVISKDICLKCDCIIKEKQTTECSGTHDHKAIVDASEGDYLACGADDEEFVETEMRVRSCADCTLKGSEERAEKAGKGEKS